MTPTPYPANCQQCGNRLQPGDKFCGECGAAALSPPPQAEQVIPRQEAASHAPSRSRRLPWVLAVSVLAVLVVGTGALAAVAFQDRLGFLGEPNTESADEPDGCSRGNVEEPATPSSEETSYEDQEDAILEEFVRDYDEAVRREDWEGTYYMLDESSQAEFTEEEWAEAQQSLLDSNGLPAPLEGVTVDQNEEVSDVPARATWESATLAKCWITGATTTVLRSSGIPGNGSYPGIQWLMTGEGGGRQVRFAKAGADS